MTRVEISPGRAGNARRHGLAAAAPIGYDPELYDSLLSQCPKPIDHEARRALEDIARCEAQATEARSAWEAALSRLRDHVKDYAREEADALGAAKHAEACADLRENIAWLGLRRGAYRPPDLNFLERHFRRYARQKSALHNHLETLRKLERYLERLETRRRKALQSLNRALLTAGAGERA